MLLASVELADKPTNVLLVKTVETADISSMSCFYVINVAAECRCSPDTWSRTGA